MNTFRIALGAVMAGLAAVAAALVTCNFVRAAEERVSVAAWQAMHATSSGVESPRAAVVDPDFVWAYHTSGLLVFVSAPLSDSFAPTPEPGKGTAPAVRRAGSAKRVRLLVTDAQTATEAERNEADLNALFAVAVRAKPARVEAAKNAQGERGKRVYLDLCFACHQTDGRGLPGTFPSLAKSDYMAADRTRAIRIVLEGLAGSVTVNGETISSVMPAQKTVLTDEQIADVLTYAFNAWENPGGEFTASQVAAIRNERIQD